MICKNIKLGKPKVVSFAPLYYHFDSLPTDPDEWFQVQALRLHDSSGNVIWDSIPFLNPKKHSNFNWVFNPYISMGFCNRVNGYDIHRLNGEAKGEYVIDTLEYEGAIFRITGHYIVDTTLSKTAGYYILPYYGKIYANLNTIDAIGRCGAGWDCLSHKCYPFSERDSLYLDDVLIATAIGCGTNLGESSIVQSLLDLGVDCVIGTKKTVLIEIMNLWNYYFWDYLNNGYSYMIASSRAYSEAHRRLSAFLNVENLQQFYAPGTDIGTYTSDIIIREQPNTTILNQYLEPARYGSTRR